MLKEQAQKGLEEVITEVVEKRDLSLGDDDIEALAKAVYVASQSDWFAEQTLV